MVRRCFRFDGDSDDARSVVDTPVAAPSVRAADVQMAGVTSALLRIPDNADESSGSESERDVFALPYQVGDTPMHLDAQRQGGNGALADLEQMPSGRERLHESDPKPVRSHVSSRRTAEGIADRIIAQELGLNTTECAQSICRCLLRWLMRTTWGW
jgi:hypothetical protein